MNCWVFTGYICNQWLVSLNPPLPIHGNAGLTPIFGTPWRLQVGKFLGKISHLPYVPGWQGRWWMHWMTFGSDFSDPSQVQKRSTNSCSRGLGPKDPRERIVGWWLVSSLKLVAYVQHRYMAVQPVVVVCYWLFLPTYLESWTARGLTNIGISARERVGCKESHLLLLMASLSMGCAVVFQDWRCQLIGAEDQLW